MTMVKAAKPNNPWLSCTFTEKLKEPSRVGVPLIAPLALRLRPCGNAPDSNEKAYGGTPPVACNNALYG